MKTSDPMTPFDPSGPHHALHQLAHGSNVDPGLGTTILVSLGMTAPLALITDTAARMLTNILTTLIVGLVVGAINRRAAVNALRAEQARAAAAQPPPSTPPAP